MSGRSVHAHFLRHRLHAALQEHSEIDIALDIFPCTRALTLLAASWTARAAGPAHRQAA